MRGNPYSIIRLRYNWNRRQRRKAVITTNLQPIAVTHHASIFLFGKGYETLEAEGREDVIYSSYISAESLHLAIRDVHSMEASLGLDKLGVHTCDHMPTSGISV